MGWFSRKKQPAPAAAATHRMAPNPHRHWAPSTPAKAEDYLNIVLRGGFTSANVNRLLHGWDSTSQTIDYYLQQELRPMRARSRAMVRQNPYGKRFLSTIKANVVGPQGVQVQARSLRLNGDLDTPANDAIEAAWRAWGQRHCDYHGRHTWVDLQNLAISCAAQDGEFLFEKRYTGEHGFQLKIIDPELLDVEKNEKVGKGEIRLGVEYNADGRRVRYHFRRKTHPVAGGYDNYEKYTLPASSVIHGFIGEWPDQSRGTPWMHASLERSKHLEKYEEAAIVKARSTAATMAVLRSTEADAYEGDEDYGDGVTLDQYEAGTIKDIGNRDVVNLDSDYPHQMYGAFVKAHLQGIASGLGISYHSLSNDLEGVNYSSIRAGVLEDREVFKGLQNWFVRSLVQPVYEEWVAMCVMRQVIRIGRVPLAKPVQEYFPAHYQARRWAWVDPQKDGTANQMAIDNLTKSRSAIIREQGDDPESVFREIRAEQDMLDAMGLAPISSQQTETNDVEAEQ
jgi:lambda family phage portal protein